MNSPVRVIGFVNRRPFIIDHYAMLIFCRPRSLSWGPALGMAYFGIIALRHPRLWSRSARDRC